MAMRRGTLGCLSVLLLWLGATGCGEDVSVTIVIGPAPPRVVAVHPDNGSVNVDPALTVSAVFNQDMDPASINPGTFTLRSAGESIAGTVIYESSSRTAGFRPLALLAPLTTYTATLTAGVRSDSGHSLAGNFIWSFTTRDGNSGTLPLIETAAPAGADAAVAVNTAGIALAVWVEGDGAGRHVFASRFDPVAKEWSLAERIGAGDVDSDNPRVAVDAEGDFTVVWEEEEGLASRVFPAVNAPPD